MLILVSRTGNLLGHFSGVDWKGLSPDDDFIISVQVLKRRAFAYMRATFVLVLLFGVPIKGKEERTSDPYTTPWIRLSL